CEDHYASLFMDERGLKLFEPFRSETMPNLSNATRCRIIDDLLRAKLQHDREHRIVTIGAGFDTRPFRMVGGIWAEVDELGLLELKDAKLPISGCDNPLSRIAIDFAKDSLEEGLRDLATDERVTVVIEGVWFYLNREAIATALRVLRSLFPAHDLICDLMDARFFQRYGRRLQAKLSPLGAVMTDRPRRPAEMFLESGYEQLNVVPMMERAHELGALQAIADIPSWASWLMLLVTSPAMKGYAVYAFSMRTG
ncbi:MAG: class I SAM-dependent methyltransferase, partial [Myxococcota bacterium]